MIKFSVDPQANAAYVEITNKPVVETICWHGINLDLDADGEPVGIEILNVGVPEQGKARGPDPHTGTTYTGAPGSRMDPNNPGGTGIR